MRDHLIPLSEYCATICEVECCGLDACDFSFIHIASYCLAQNPSEPLRILQEIVNEAETLKINYGNAGASAKGICISDINEKMTGERVDIFAGLIIAQAVKALKILEQEETQNRQPAFVWKKVKGAIT